MISLLCSDRTVFRLGLAVQTLQMDDGDIVELRDANSIEDHGSTPGAG